MTETVGFDFEDIKRQREDYPNYYYIGQRVFFRLHFFMRWSHSCFVMII